MKNIFTLLALMCGLNAAWGQNTFSLLQEGRVRSGTGKAVLVTSGTLIDTVKATQAGYVLTWDGSDILFSAPSGGSSVVPAALTKSDDTNVTLTLGGTPLLALLQPVSLTLGWTGTLADSRIASASAWNGKKAGNDSISITGYTSLYRNSLNLLKSDSIAFTGYTSLYRNSLNLLKNDSIALAGFTSLYRNSLNLLKSDSTAFTGYTSLYRNSLNLLKSDSIALTGFTSLYRNSLNLLKSDTAAMLTPYVEASEVRQITRPDFSRKLSNQATASAIDITGLSVPIAANDSIYIIAEVRFSTSASNGVRFAVTIPSGAMMSLTCQGPSSATIGKGPAMEITTSGVQTNTQSAFTAIFLETTIKGWVKNSSTAGTIQIQGASVSGGNTVTYFSSSNILAFKL